MLWEPSREPIQNTRDVNEVHGAISFMLCSRRFRAHSVFKDDRPQLSGETIHRGRNARTQAETCAKNAPEPGTTGWVENGSRAP
eukprot:6538935-Pyramimonas_sp.AAC.1